MRDRDGEGQNDKNGDFALCSVVSGTGAETQQIVATMETGLQRKVQFTEVPALTPHAMQTKGGEQQRRRQQPRADERKAR